MRRAKDSAPYAAASIRLHSIVTSFPCARKSTVTVGESYERAPLRQGRGTSEILGTPRNAIQPRIGGGCRDAGRCHPVDSRLKRDDHPWGKCGLGGECMPGYAATVRPHQV